MIIFEEQRSFSTRSTKTSCSPPLCRQSFDWETRWGRGNIGYYAASPKVVCSALSSSRGRSPRTTCGSDAGGGDDDGDGGGNETGDGDEGAVGSMAGFGGVDLDRVNCSPGSLTTGYGRLDLENNILFSWSFQFIKLGLFVIWEQSLIDK